jgi:hypothetical protein
MWQTDFMGVSMGIAVTVPDPTKPRESGFVLIPFHVDFNNPRPSSDAFEEVGIFGSGGEVFFQLRNAAFHFREDPVGK